MTIPSDLRTPGAYVYTDASQASNNSTTKRALIVGIYAGAGGGRAAVADAIYSVPTLAEAARLFGVDAPIYHMIERYRQNDPIGELHAAGVTVAGGAAATGTWTVTGTATEARTFYCYVGDRSRERIAVDVDSGDDQTAVAAAIAAAVVATSNIYVEATNVAGALTWTSLWNGAQFHDIRIRYNERGAAGGEILPAGISIAYTANLGEASAGSGTVDLTNVIAAMGDLPFDFVITGITDDTNLDLLEAELDSRWGYSRQIYGHAFGAYQGTQGELTTYGNARNSEHSTIFGVEGQNDTAGGNYDPKSRTVTWAWAAGIAGAIAQANRNSAARPYKTLQAAGNVAPAEADRFTGAEVETLLSDGIATTYYNAAGEVFIQRAITTYQTNDASAPDTAYLDYTTPAKLTEVNRDLVNGIESKFPRAVLVNEVPAGAPADGSFVDPEVIKGYILGLYVGWIKDGLCEDLAGFQDELTVTRDGSDPNRVNVFAPVRLTGSLLVTAVTNSFRFAN